MTINRKTLALAVAAVAALLLLAAAPAAASVKLAPRHRSLKNNNQNQNNNQDNNNQSTNQLPAPVVTCVSSTVSSITVEICPGDKAPSGFKLQYEEIESFIASGGFPCGNGDVACRATITEAFQGAEDCWSLTIGAGPIEDVTFQPTSCSGELNCGTTFVFRAFALGGQNFNASAPSQTVSCSTSPCVAPIACFTSSPSDVVGDSCGLCRPSCGVISRSIVCSFYNVDDPACKISARGGGGNVCAGTDVCCVVNPPNTIEPAGTPLTCSPLPTPPALDLAPATFAAVRKP